jgi:hypothetical protein
LAGIIGYMMVGYPFRSVGAWMSVLRNLSTWTGGKYVQSEA